MCAKQRGEDIREAFLIACIFSIFPPNPQKEILPRYCTAGRQAGREPTFVSLQKRRRQKNYTYKDLKITETKTGETKIGERK